MFQGIMWVQHLFCITIKKKFILVFNFFNMHLCDVMIISYMVMKRHKFDVNFFFLVNWVAIDNERHLQSSYI
jgi:hypothetical protein